MQGGEQQDAPLEGERGPRSHDPCGVPGILMLQKESSTENVWKSNVYIKKNMCADKQTQAKGNQTQNVHVHEKMNPVGFPSSVH